MKPASTANASRKNIARTEGAEVAPLSTSRLGPQKQGNSEDDAQYRQSDDFEGGE